ncbi:MAG TPA: hypothetical protein VKB35_18380 [Ktedonobacteraceae bacterium]|nr:hypothetical protein [Ktedonobacteraceae bacterium]
MKLNTDTTMQYRFALHTRRLTIIAIVSTLVLVVAGLLVLLATFPALASAHDLLFLAAYLIGFLALAFLLPMLILLYSYRRSGVWIEPDRVRVQFPGENQQEMAWSEALFAVNEGEEYLRASKGKEGLGHVFGETRYIRLHLEGLPPEQRIQAEQALAEHIQVRRPQAFTLMTLLNPRGELVARGRLYLFDNELLCAENRGEKRVFFYAPLKDLSSVKQRDSFYVGRLECEAFTLTYQGKEYVVMLGYETTISSGIGRSSHWSVTGRARDWVDAL